MKVSFIIPLHNEEKNSGPMLERVLTYAKQKKWNFEIIPVDDKSRDRTKQILQEYSKKYSVIKPLYRSAKNEERGNTMGVSLVEGTRKATGDIIIWTMGDLADDTETYGEIVKLLGEGYDMVFGSRYMPGGSRGNLDPLKAFLSSWGTLLARSVFGVPVHDITNAFRGFKKELIERITLDSSGFSISPEFAIKAHLAAYKLGEVPTVYTNRIEGVSNFKLYNMTKSYLTLYWRLLTRYKFQQGKYDFLSSQKPV
jgi:glycosyltransferase involved in cell wall biosynthesis